MTRNANRSYVRSQGSESRIRRLGDMANASRRQLKPMLRSKRFSQQGRKGFSISDLMGPSSSCCAIFVSRFMPYLVR
jgi:hypothetical protein